MGRFWCSFFFICLLLLLAMSSVCAKKNNSCRRTFQGVWHSTFLAHSARRVGLLWDGRMWHTASPPPWDNLIRFRNTAKANTKQQKKSERMARERKKTNRTADKRKRTTVAQTQNPKKGTRRLRQCHGAKPTKRRTPQVQCPFTVRDLGRPTGRNRNPKLRCALLGGVSILGVPGLAEISGPAF